MKKPSIIIGKRQILLSCLTAMLAIAVYINYSLSQNEIVTPVTELTEHTHYGDTEFVNAPPEVLPAQEPDADAVKADAGAVSADVAGAEEDGGSAEVLAADPSADYFAQARLQKSVDRDEAVQTLQTIMGGGDITNDEAVTTALNAVQLSNLIESEGRIESLIKSQGFADCVVYLDGDTAKVVVRSDGLEASDAALIKDLILGEVSVIPENIRIFEVK